MDWECNVKKTENGFLVEYKEEIDENTVNTARHVFEAMFVPNESEYIQLYENDPSYAEKFAFSRVVHFLAEHFGIDQNRFGNDNLIVSWQGEGRKYCPPDEEETQIDDENLGTFEDEEVPEEDVQQELIGLSDEEIDDIAGIDVESEELTDTEKEQRSVDIDLAFPDIKKK